MNRDVQPHTIDTTGIPPFSSSPTAQDDPTPPEYSPITPKTVPALPVITAATTSTNVDSAVEAPPQLDGVSDQAIAPAEAIPQLDGTSDKAIAPAEYIPPPPAQPFSSDESIDGLALKTAISSLQFQRLKAKEDIKTLEQMRKAALESPEDYANALVTGKLKEKRHDFGGTQEVLDAQAQPDDAAETFGNVPGPQNVVRMPHIEWSKYNIMGQRLDAMHEQQRQYPGTAFQANKGREFSATAPFSPWQDGPNLGHSRNTSDGSRKEGTPVATPMNEHPYETRRNSKQ